MSPGQGKKRPTAKKAKPKRHVTSGKAKAKRHVTSKTETTVGDQPKTDKPWQFKPGQSGNPAGRPKGSRNKFCKAMLEDFAEVWAIGGPKALRAMAKKAPGAFVNASLRWLPQEFDIGDKTQSSFRQIWEALAAGKMPAPPPLPEEGNDDE